jgi:hypothetical protein
MEGFLEVDDVDAGALRENEPPHLGVPSPRLVPEMDTRFQQILQLRLRHALPFWVSSAAAVIFAATPEGPGSESSDVWDRLDV